MWYAPIIGYGFSVFAEAILVKSLVETLWDSVSPGSSSSPRFRPQLWQGDALARVEGVLYVAFLQLGLGQLIGIWLALKVAAQWKRWMDEGDEKSQMPDGRTTLHVFLIGNAFSIIYSFVGFKLIGWVNAGEIIKIIWVTLSVIGLTLTFWAWIPGRRPSRFL